jgi:hypothetical protein
LGFGAYLEFDFWDLFIAGAADFGGGSMPKLVLFVFNPDPMCFIHVLLNGLALHAEDMGGLIVVEGGATGLVPELAKTANPLHKLWEEARAKGIIAGVCRACANKTGTLEAAKAQGLTLLGDIKGHPSMAAYRQKGFEIVSF